MVQCSQLYRGFIPTIIRDISFAAIQFVIYEYNKVHHVVLNLLEPAIKVHKPTASSIGSLSLRVHCGGNFCSHNNALGCAKDSNHAESFTQGTLDSIADLQEKIPNVFVLGTAILNKEGARSLLHGLTPRVAWMTIGGGIFFGAYEQAKSFLS